jgi:hypothetical protein
MSNINEIFLTQLAQSIGVSFNIKNNILGSNFNPNSAIFNLSQIASILTKGKPRFGVYDETNGFGVSTNFNFNFDDTSKLFYFGPGRVFYQAQMSLVPSQYIPAVSSNDTPGQKLFNFYLDYNDFIFSRQSYVATVTAVSGFEITVNQLPPVAYVNNFTKTSLNGYIVAINFIDSVNLKIYFVQNVETLNYVAVGSNINLIYQPTLKFLTTTALNGATPPDVQIPYSGISIAKAILNIDSNFNYSTLSTSKTFLGYPEFQNPQSYFPDSRSYNAFLTFVNNSIKSIQDSQTYSFESDLVNSFFNYTGSIAGINTSFDDYWHSRPYRPQENFEYGLNFNGLQQTYFDSRFKDFWYFLNNNTLTKTLAIFRGDIYRGSSRALSNNQLSINVTSARDFSGKSTLFNGSWTYGVSAVNATGEYNPNYLSGQNFYLNKLVNNFVSWTSVSAISPSPLFFHVYKNVYSSTGFIQQRLTSPFEVTNYTLTDDNSDYSTTNAFGVATNYFAFPITQGAGNTGIIGGIQFYGYFNSNTSTNYADYPLLGVQSCTILNGGYNYKNPQVIISGNGFGAAISLTTATVGPKQGVIVSATVTSFGSGYISMPTLTVVDSPQSNGTGAVIQPILSYLSAGIATGDINQPIGTSIVEFASLTLADIPTTPEQFALPLKQNKFFKLNANVNYWAVFNMNVPYAVTLSQQLQLNHTQNYVGKIASSVNNSNWVAGVSSVMVAKLGLVDQGLSGNLAFSNGVYLTEELPTIPSRLRVYVPNLEFNTEDGRTSQENVGYNSVLPIQNSMDIYVTAYNSNTGVQKTMYCLLQKDTPRNTSIPIGNATDLFDTIINVQVSANVASGVKLVNGIIQWDINDFFTIDTIP